MRNTFQEQLEQLNVELIRMGALCEEAISDATKAYLEGDRELGRQACRLEQEIDNQERDIESQCMKLLLRQQPVRDRLLAGGELLRQPLLHRPAALKVHKNFPVHIREIFLPRRETFCPPASLISRR